MNATAFKGKLPWNDRSLADIEREKAQGGLSQGAQATCLENRGISQEICKTPRDDSLAIIAQVALEHGVTSAQILGPNRKQAFVKARAEAMRRVMAARPNMSWPMLGRIFNRDHTTCMHHVGNKCDWGKPSGVIARNLPEDSRQHTEEVGVALP